MSQLVRLEGKHSTQNAHCAVYIHLGAPTGCPLMETTTLASSLRSRPHHRSSASLELLLELPQASVQRHLRLPWHADPEAEVHGARPDDILDIILQFTRNGAVEKCVEALSICGERHQDHVLGRIINRLSTNLVSAPCCRALVHSSDFLVSPSALYL